MTRIYRRLWRAATHKPLLATETRSHSRQHVTASVVLLYASTLSGGAIAEGSQHITLTKPTVLPSSHGNNGVDGQGSGNDRNGGQGSTAYQVTSPFPETPMRSPLSINGRVMGGNGGLGVNGGNGGNGGDAINGDHFFLFN
ncbi:hypothetical protein NMD97_09775 [Edwardsiella tarda]